MHFFRPSMQESADRRLLLEKELRVAINQNQFVLFYQPQLDMTGKLRSAEALIRWRHPEKGFISPAEFIPVAEETHLILPIGAFVLEEACRQIKVWETSGLDFAHIAINVSSRQFRQPGFVEQVRTAINDNGISVNKLVIELTEGVVIDDIEDTIIKMQDLNALGVLISIDDFGTGYSSLSYLKQLPLGQLKIDRSFIRDISSNTDDAIIVETIIAMAKHLGLEVVAEGVETREQLEFLAEKNCEIYQGYYFSKPLPASEFLQLDFAFPKKNINPLH